MARAIKDILLKRKKGFQVKRAGWDTHGLPVELGTEKNYKRRYWENDFIEEYNEACKTVMRYTDVWNDLTEKWAIGLIWKIRM
jgi:isoleucyl-tRNA synthetase